MSSYLLDTSAFLAFANREPGGDRVQAVLRTSFISAVNASEVIGKLTGQGFSLDEAEKYLVQFVKGVIPFDNQHAVLAASFLPATRALGLSLGDRACLALAKQLGLPVLTADQVWSKLDIGVSIEVIRPLTPQQ
jgi:ribonuclease VapC